MKQFLSLAFIILLIFSFCGDKTPKIQFAKDSDQYQFFTLLSDSLNEQVLNPEKAQALITTSTFTVWSYDIMPTIYASFSNYKDKIKSLPLDRLKSMITQNAQREAEKQLLFEKATSEGITTSDSVVQQRMDQIYKSRGGQENFEKYLNQQGYTLDYVINDVKNSIIVQNYLNDKVYAQITVSDEDVEKLYTEDKTATVRHILFMTQGKTPEQIAEIRNKAESVLERARAEEDFAALAKEFSEDPGSKDKGGMYKEFPKGRMVKAFEDASFNLPIGSISDLVETPYGYHIIKIEDRQKETKPLEEVKTQLTNMVRRNKRMDVYNELIEQIKKDKKYTEHFDGLV